MRTALTAALAAAALASVLASPASAPAMPPVHECQKPVVTGVEVYDVKGVPIKRACELALALFKWENAGHWTALYGCRRASRNAAGYPFLRLHSFHGWRLALRGRPYGEFEMSRDRRSFFVTGTDFPLNCT